MTAVTADAPIEPAAAPATTPKAKGKSRARWLVAGAVLAAALGGGGALYASTRGHESTDNAQVDAEVVAVPARVGGIVSAVHFEENQTVHAGDLLAELDNEGPKAKLAQAEATLEAADAAAIAADADARVAETNATGNKAIAEASLQTAKAGTATAVDQIAEADAAIKTSTAALQQAQTNRDRTKSLFEAGAIAKAPYDDAVTALAIATANLDAAKARRNTLKSSVGQASSKLDEASARAKQTSDVASVVAQAQARAKAAHAQVATAKAARDLAALDLSYTRILAPHDGVVSKKSIAEGQSVTAGQPIVQLVTPGVWVTANFKETQIQKMHVGQPVTFHVDAFSKVELSGEIESLSGATGSRFTLLPPDNATGNFTKVVQRVPVRVRVTSLPEGVVLRPGMSVELTVDTNR